MTIPRLLCSDEAVSLTRKEEKITSLDEVVMPSWILSTRQRIVILFPVLLRATTVEVTMSEAITPKLDAAEPQASGWPGDFFHAGDLITARCRLLYPQG